MGPAARQCRFGGRGLLVAGFMHPLRMCLPISSACRPSLHHHSLLPAGLLATQLPPHLERLTVRAAERLASFFELWIHEQFCMRARCPMELQWPRALGCWGRVGCSLCGKVGGPCHLQAGEVARGHSLPTFQRSHSQVELPCLCVLRAAVIHNVDVLLLLVLRRGHSARAVQRQARASAPSAIPPRRSRRSALPRACHPPPPDLGPTRSTSPSSTSSSCAISMSARSGGDSPRPCVSLRMLRECTRAAHARSRAEGPHLPAGDAACLPSAEASGAGPSPQRELWLTAGEDRGETVAHKQAHCRRGEEGGRGALLLRVGGGG